MGRTYKTGLWNLNAMYLNECFESGYSIRHLLALCFTQTEAKLY